MFDRGHNITVIAPSSPRLEALPAECLKELILTERQNTMVINPLGGAVNRITFSSHHI
jgi:hypothetical protein